MYELDINLYKFLNWSISIVVSLHKWLSHFCCRKTYIIDQNQTKLENNNIFFIIDQITVSMVPLIPLYKVFYVY